jgi:hypothetical protein
LSRGDDDEREVVHRNSLQTSSDATFLREVTGADAWHPAELETGATRSEWTQEWINQRNG